MKQGQFQQHNYSKPNGQHIGQPVTSASWASEKRFSMNIRAITYDFQLNLYISLITYIKKSIENGKRRLSLPLSPLYHKNIYLSDVKDLRRSLMAVFNYVLLSEGQIKSLTPLNPKQFKKGILEMKITTIVSLSEE